MTERERVLTLLRGGRPDRVPWLGDLAYWATALVGRGLKPAGIAGCDEYFDRPERCTIDQTIERAVGFQRSTAYVDWHRNLGVGFYLQGYFPFKTIVEDCRVKELREGNRRLREIVTPKGTLRECWQWMPDDFTEGPVEHLVKSVSDLPAYRYLHEHTRYEPDYDLARERMAQLRGNGAGVMLAYLPKSPLMQMVALDAGIMAVVEMTMDDPDLLAETIAAVKASHDRSARIAVDSPAEVLMMPENLSSEVVGTSLFEQFMRPYQTEWAAAIRAAGKYSCIHMDGTLKGLLRQECTVGLTFIEAMTPAPVGDLAVADWAAFCGNHDTILWGGIPGGFFTPLVSDEAFDEHVKRTLEIMRKAPRYVLGVADQVPPSGLDSRVRRVRELVDEYGAYEA
jgi:hypothetical protein